MPAMSEPAATSRFFSLCAPDTGAADEAGSPVEQLVRRLRTAGVTFELCETLLSDEEAAKHPDTAELYPQLVDAGLHEVVLYEFFTSAGERETADRIATELAESWDAADGQGS